MQEDEAWLTLVARICAERRAAGGAGDDDRSEWLARSEAKLREANARACVPEAALWLAARAWALAAAAEDPDPGPASTGARGCDAGAVRRLALDGDLVSPGTGGGLCAAEAGNVGMSTRGRLNE